MPLTPCDLLITNAYVLTMDEAFHRYPDGAVAITGLTGVAVLAGTARRFHRAARAIAAIPAA